MTPLPTSVITIPQIAALVVAIIASITDIRTAKIYNWLTLPGALIGIITVAVASALTAPSQPLAAGMQGALAGFTGMLAGILIMGAMKFFLRQLGHGDTKLMGALGAFVGVGMVVATFLYFCAVYAVFCCGSLCIAFPWRQLAVAYASRNTKGLDLGHFNQVRKQAIPIAPFIGLGLVFAIVFQHPTLRLFGFEH